MPDERQAQPAHGIVASVGQRHSLGRARLHAAKRSTVLLSGPVRDRSMLHGTNAAAVSCQPCEIQAACVKHGAETLARHAYPRVPHRRRPQGRRRTLLRRCRGCGNRRSRRWSRLRWWCDRPHPETRLQCSSHEQQQRRDDQNIPTHVRVDARACCVTRTSATGRPARGANRARNFADNRAGGAHVRLQRRLRPAAGGMARLLLTSLLCHATVATALLPRINAAVIVPGFLSGA